MRRLAAISLCVVLTLIFGGFLPTAAGMDEGISAYRSRDFAAAFREFETLAKTGNVAAQYNVAQMYRHAQGVPQNYPAAMEWYEKAAEAGFSSAQNNLARMHMDGSGVVVDYETAVRWWNRAARQDHVGAQFNLGEAYLKGLGVAADPVEALFWYSLAMVHGYVGAQPARERIASTMNLEQLTQVTERVNSWQPVVEASNK